MVSFGFRRNQRVGRGEVFGAFAQLVLAALVGDRRAGQEVPRRTLANRFQ
jgi:hypothetical protein